MTWTEGYPARPFRRFTVKRDLWFATDPTYRTEKLNEARAWAWRNKGVADIALYREAVPRRLAQIAYCDYPPPRWARRR